MSKKIMTAVGLKKIETLESQVKNLTDVNQMHVKKHATYRKDMTKTVNEMGRDLAKFQVLYQNANQRLQSIGLIANMTDLVRVEGVILDGTSVVSADGEQATEEAKAVAAQH